MSKDTEEHSCPTCAGATCEAGHMCTPAALDDEECDYCGALIVSERHMCTGKVPDVAYICQTCGRTAVGPQFLCKPEPIQ